VTDSINQLSYDAALKIFSEVVVLVVVLFVDYGFGDFKGL